MATRKALALVNGYFQEVNTPTDKLDFAGNTTTDLAEGSNLYYLDSRARSAITVTDTGGDGSLTYNSASGALTYTGPSASEARAHFSVAVGSGLTYNSSTGVFGTSSIPNSQLQNSAITLGSTAIALGSSASTIAGLLSVTSTAVITNDSGFRVRNNSDITKQVALNVAGVSTGTTRTLSVPDESGTISTQDFATAIAVALG